MSRQQEIKDFLKKAKLVRPQLTWLPHDASGRRYARVKSGKKSYILMDSPANEKPDLFYKIDKLLEKNKIFRRKFLISDLKQSFNKQSFNYCQQISLMLD